MKRTRDLVLEDLGSSFDPAPPVSPWGNNALVLPSLRLVISEMEVAMPSVSLDCFEGQMILHEQKGFLSGREELI